MNRNLKSLIDDFFNDISPLVDIPYTPPLSQMCSKPSMSFLSGASEESDSSKKISDEELSPPRFPPLDDSSETSPERINHNNNNIKNKKNHNDKPVSGCCILLDDGCSRDSGIIETAALRQPFSDRSNLPPTSTPLSSLTAKFKSKSFSVSQDNLICDSRSSECSDDGFIDMLETTCQPQVPITTTCINQLVNCIKLPLPDDEEKENTPLTRRVCRKRLSVSTISITKRQCPVDCYTSNSKRRRKDSCSISCSPKNSKTFLKRKVPPVTLHRTLSFPESKLLTEALDSNEHLVGDYTREPSLPIIPGRHQGLRSVSVQTVAQLSDGRFGPIKYSIIDCRYPYEYEGGHIRGSLNLYLKTQIQTELFDKKRTDDDDSWQEVLIFHCEFSSERGPKLARHTREMDRSQNHYPRLHYPEIYIMDGGYKEFYEIAQNLCHPPTYQTMADPLKCDDYKLYRALAKSENDMKEIGKKTKRCGLKRVKTSARKLID